MHDPTQGMRQGNDVGTQYRSGIYATTPEQEQTARDLTKEYGEELARRGFDPITTEIKLVEDGEPAYYYAEDYHQQYLYKNPNGYRCHSHHRSPVPGSPLSPYEDRGGPQDRHPADARQGDEEPSHRSPGLIDAPHA